MKKLSLPIISIIALALSLISLVLRTVSFTAFYDKLGYYTSGASLPIIANVISVLAIIFFLVVTVFCTASTEKINEPQSVSKYAAILPLTALVFAVVNSIMNLTKSAEGSEPQSNIIPVLTILGAIAGVAFFFLIFFMNKQTIATVYCGLGALVFVFFSWMSSYFDFSSPINSDQRTFFYVSCAGAMLFIFNEMCAVYGSVKPKFYYFSLFASIFTIASSASPALIGNAANKFASYNTLEADIFFAALLIYGCVRLITLLKCKKSEPLPTQNEEIPEAFAESAE